MNYGHFSLSSLPGVNNQKENPKMVIEPIQQANPQPINYQSYPNQFPMNYYPANYSVCNRCRCGKCTEVWKKLKSICIEEKSITIDPSLAGGVIEENNSKKEVIFKTRDGKEVKFLSKK